MRTHNLALFTVLGVLILSGCSKKSESNSPTLATVPAPSPTPFVPTTPTVPTVQPTGSSSAPQIGTNGTVAFTPVSKAMMENYVASHPLNNPTDYRLQVQLKQAGSLRYAGDVKISYVDNGQTYTGSFNAPTGVNSDLYALQDAGMLKSNYNYWFNLAGKTVFTGFFQDSFGAIVLVIDNSINLGDGQGSGTVSGSIWFKNFAYSFAPQSVERNCWYIYMGPYQCRLNSVINKNALPTEGEQGYRKLGTFSGLVTSQAFQ